MNKSAAKGRAKKMNTSSGPSFVSVSKRRASAVTACESLLHVDILDTVGPLPSPSITATSTQDPRQPPTMQVVTTCLVTECPAVTDSAGVPVHATSASVLEWLERPTHSEDDHGGRHLFLRSETTAKAVHRKSPRLSRKYRPDGILRGYCECCRVYYDQGIEQHRTTKSHRDFATNVRDIVRVAQICG